MTPGSEASSGRANLFKELVISDEAQVIGDSFEGRDGILLEIFERDVDDDVFLDERLECLPEIPLKVEVRAVLSFARLFRVQTEEFFEWLVVVMELQISHVIVKRYQHVFGISWT